MVPRVLDPEHHGHGAPRFGIPGSSPRYTNHHDTGRLNLPCVSRSVSTWFEPSVPTLNPSLDVPFHFHVRLSTTSIKSYDNPDVSSQSLARKVNRHTARDPPRSRRRDAGTAGCLGFASPSAPLCPRTLNRESLTQVSVSFA